MDRNDGQEETSNPYMHQEIFDPAPETRVEHRFPGPAGIIPVPRGSRGPRSLYLRRYGDSFGFTLRHFIVYPPDSVAEQTNGKHAAVGALLAPMDTIFVKHVKDRSPAKQAGLQRGDRLVAVNGVLVKDKSYSQVVQLVVNSPEYLHLLVVPKEEDVLQRFFAETAYNPVSNQNVYQEHPSDLQSAQRILSQRLGRGASEFQVDALSWRSLQQPYGQVDLQPLQRAPFDRGQRSAESILYSEPKPRQNQQEIYAEIHPHDTGHKSFSRAAPQVPLYRKMGRRASEGNALAEYEPPDYSSLNPEEFEDYNMKTMYKSSYLPESGDMSGLNYTNTAGCRLSLDAGRRESTSSLSSSIADGSKDSLVSYDSASTLTGHETDDSAIMTRFRKIVQQKEDFLKMPTNSVDQALIRREFYGRPKKLEKQVWPPNEKDLPLKAAKPIHHNFQRVKDDIENERDLVGPHNGHQVIGGGAMYSVPQQRLAMSPREKAVQSSDKMYEAETAPSGYDSLEINGSSLEGSALTDDRRVYLPGLQLVHKRAKEFESGRAIPDDDPAQSNRMNFSLSELARLSSKKLVPNVCERAHEYEVKVEPRRGASETSINTNEGVNPPSVLKRIQRDSRSLDSSGSNASSASIHEILFGAGKRLSGNVTISSGSKFIHCPPPSDWQKREPTAEDIASNDTTRMRTRSYSAESWVAALGDSGREGSRRISRQEAIERSKMKVDDKPVVVKRRPKNTNIVDDERAMRRESYLKATEGGRMHIDCELSDSGDISSQVLRSGSASSSNASLEREKSSANASPVEKESYTVVIKEAPLHCKILEVDGKRSADRSWRQVYIVLKGPKLYFYKDRHHQSPIGTSDVLDHSPLSSGVDMRTSVVRVAEDYTKRKNVFRVSAVKPCRSEFLLQADNTEDFTDWVKTLQEQVASSTDAELDPLQSKQQAVPQLVPASTSIQVQGSHLSPQLGKAKTTNARNRSPTGQSPVSKSRKPSQVPEPTATSPKSKTWRGRMVKQFKKFNQGANSPSSPTAPEGSTFGVALEDCIASQYNIYVPRFVEVCTDIIDQRGLQTIGIYRVPGNNASITALTEEINRNYEDIPLDDPRWNDLHVVSSLLKSYFRKMPDSLVTVQLYPYFIKADKIEDPRLRMEELKRLVKSLPIHNYHTLKHIILHLKRVAESSEVNKMKAKNLAIVFGPTIVRPEGENMESMVNHMTNQCKIVETLLTHADWFFQEKEDEENEPVPVPLLEEEECESGPNQALLLHNIGKYEALKDPKEKNGALFSSIISAAQRKVKRKPHKASSSLPESKDEATSPTNLKVFPTQSFSPSDLKECTSPDGKLRESIPTTVMDIEKKTCQSEKMPGIYYYCSDRDKYEKMIKNFKQETEAMLQLPRKMEISVNNTDNRPVGQHSSSASNVNQNSRLSTKPTDFHLLTKTHSASTVFQRAHNTDPSARNSLNYMDNSSLVQYATDAAKNNGNNVKQFSSNSNYGRQFGGSDKRTSSNKGDSTVTDGVVNDKRTVRYTVRRGSSAENINSSMSDVANGNLKKVKYENDNECQRTGSLDSLNKLPNDDESLLSTMTKLIDEKLKEKHENTALIIPGDIPYVDESPEKQLPKKSQPNKENIPQASDLYKNPSLHKNQFNSLKSAKKEDKELKNGKERVEDTMFVESVPDNDRHVSKLTLISSNKLNSATGSKLRRSESLNKPDRTGSPLSGKLKRSESLNKAEHKLKRSDSLTKSEKTENNINKRRELSISNRRFKDTSKNKRKNGMPDRSIKRRHTVGGTKDPDKVTWLLDNKNKEDADVDLENLKEKNLRTSSPDLSSTRRDRFFFEISLIDSENMVVALRQHLIGTRPQSFPESTVFKVPLESHV